MKVVAFNCSPRRENSLSYEFLKVSVDFFRKKEVDVDLYHLIDYPIRPCMGCYSERKEECNPTKCTQGELEDAMKSFHNILILSDIIIFATPVYWYSVPGILKVFIDRLTSLENVGFLLKGKVGGVIAVGEEEGCSMVISWLALTLNMMGFMFPPFAFVYYNKSKNKEEIKKEIFEMSSNLYELAKCVNKENINWF